MASLSDLNILKEGDHNWVELDHFMTFLRKHSKPSDIPLRRSNIISQSTKLANGLLQEPNIKLNFMAVLKFIISHSDTLSVCKTLAKEIQSKVLKKTKQTVQSHETQTLFSLYQRIAVTEFTSISVVKDIQHLDIPSLHTEYKQSFDETSWLNICKFENFFSQFHYNYEEDFDKILLAKFKIYENLLSLKQIGQEMNKQSQKVITNRKIRQNVRDEYYDITVTGKQVHKPILIDVPLTSDIQEHFPNVVEEVIVSDHNHSTTNNSVYLFIELDMVFTDSDQQILNEISKWCISWLKRKHSLALKQIFFMVHGSLESYKSEGMISRFKLRDDLFSGKLKNNVYFVENIKISDDDIEVDDSSHCNTCFSSEGPKALDLANFDVFSEWQFDVPFSVQILLEHFLNKRSMNRLEKTDSKDDYLCKKLTRLYSIYDTLLNTLNKNHLGIIQESNTSEITMHYSNISSVFSVTGPSGTTSSLVSAEKKIKDRATEERCYFNTYLRQYQIRYDTAAGEVELNINLRDCYLNMMLDNLVRLTFKRDPNPGECRTNQLCMLPITLQGLPRDSVITDEWHDPAICDGSISCRCKLAITLDKGVMMEHLLIQSNREKEVHENFSSLCRWGAKVVWENVQNHNILEKLHLINPGAQLHSNNAVESNNIADGELSDIQSNSTVENVSKIQTIDDVETIEDSGSGFTPILYEDEVQDIVIEDIEDMNF